jgi:hypothetical protein
MLVAGFLPIRGKGDSTFTEHAELTRKQGDYDAGGLLSISHLGRWITLVPSWSSGTLQRPPVWSEYLPDEVS